MRPGAGRTVPRKGQTSTLRGQALGTEPELSNVLIDGAGGCRFQVDAGKSPYRVLETQGSSLQGRDLGAIGAQCLVER